MRSPIPTDPLPAPSATQIQYPFIVPEIVSVDQRLLTYAMEQVLQFENEWGLGEEGAGVSDALNAWRGSVSMHVDDEWPDDARFFGLILHAEGAHTLLVEDEAPLPIQSGTLFALDPHKPHGTTSAGSDLLIWLISTLPESDAPEGTAALRQHALDMLARWHNPDSETKISQASA